MIVGLISFLLIELGLRVLDPVGIKYFFENDRYFAQLLPNEKYSYIHPANISETFQGVEIRTNSWGLRGAEFSRNKAAGKKRVLILGDSVVLGWGVPESQIFPTLLQDRLDQESIRAEVLSAGVSSWNTRNQYEYLRDEGVTFDLDVLVLIIVPNDVVPKNTGITEIPTAQLFPKTPHSSSGPNGVSDQLWIMWDKLGEHLYSVKYVQYFLKIKYRQQAFRGLNTESPSWLDARLALDGIISLSEKTGIQTLFILYGSEKSVESSNSLTLYRDFLNSRGLSYITIPDELLQDPKYRISLADSHANAAGQVLITNTIFPNLEQILLSLVEN
jgi:hypothetical protein